MRISYLGGGSDYKDFFDVHGGHVVGGTINQYLYVFLNKLSEIAPEKFRFTYRITESVDDAKEFEHPVVREALQMMGIESSLNIGTFSELPSGVGLGGSSSFTVGLIKVLKAYLDEYPDQHELAKLAIQIERETLREPGGVQDQYHASFGGFRHYHFQKSSVSVSRPLISRQAIEYISNRQLLVWVGEPRHSAKFAEVTQSHIKNKEEYIKSASELAAKTAQLLATQSLPSKNFSDLVSAVQLGWELKQQYSEEIHESVREIIRKASYAGGKAFKLCGAGGSGFVLVLAELNDIAQIVQALEGFSLIYPRLIDTGVSLLHEEW
jgi:D-glycero-alpha-D-manno-heptose-7-phosphate kinase